VTAFRGVAAPVGVCLGLFATACGGGEQGVEPVPISACGELVYEGAGEPEVIVVADNPRRGGHAVVTGEIVDAIAFVLRQRDFRAGAFRVGFQSCDDTVAGNLDAGQCRRNAQAYVETSDVVGVIGPYNSGCAELQIPIVSRTAAGPLAMISPANTFAGLTRGRRLGRPIPIASAATCGSSPMTKRKPSRPHSSRDGQGRGEQLSSPRGASTIPTWRH
jgi:branched-chain amino acid transport system substrate-binding protein